MRIVRHEERKKYVLLGWEVVGRGRVDRGYGFDGEVQRKLWEFQEKGEAVDLESCVVKKAKHSDELEIMVFRSVVCSLSSEKMNANAVMAVNVGEIGDHELRKSCNICVKVLSVADKGTFTQICANEMWWWLIVQAVQGWSCGKMRLGQSESETVKGWKVQLCASFMENATLQATVIRHADPIQGVLRVEVPLLAVGNSCMAKNMQVIGLGGLERYDGFSCLLMMKGLVSALSVVLPKVVRQLNHV